MDRRDLADVRIVLVTASGVGQGWWGRNLSPLRQIGPGPMRHPLGKCPKVEQGMDNLCHPTAMDDATWLT